MEEKTILEWLEWAKAQGYEWADEAIEYTLYEGDTVNVKKPKLSRALNDGFYWDKARRGFDYWDNVYNSLLNQNL